MAQAPWPRAQMCRIHRPRGQGSSGSQGCVHPAGTPRCTAPGCVLYCQCEAPWPTWLFVPRPWGCRAGLPHHLGCKCGAPEPSSQPPLCAPALPATNRLPGQGLFLGGCLPFSTTGLSRVCASGCPASCAPEKNRSVHRGPTPAPGKDYNLCDGCAHAKIILHLRKEQGMITASLPPHFKRAGHLPSTCQLLGASQFSWKEVLLFIPI